MRVTCWWKFECYVETDGLLSAGSGWLFSVYGTWNRALNLALGSKVRTGVLINP